MADMDAVKKEVATLKTRLDEQVARAKRQQTITLIIGVVLVLFVLFYFQFIKSQLNDMLDARTLSQMASSMVEDRVPQIRKDLESWAKEEAPNLVDDLINKVINEQFPSLRKDAVAFVKSQSKIRMEEFNQTLDIALDDLMESYRDDITRLMTELDTDTGKEALEEEVYGMIVASIDDTDIRLTMQTYLEGLQDVNARLIRLSETDEEYLMDEEIAVRNLISAIREMAERSTLDISLLDLDSEILKPLED